MPLTHRKILSHSLVWPEGRPHAVIENMHRQAPFLPTIRQAKIVRSHRRQFRVYEGGLNRLNESEEPPARSLCSRYLVGSLTGA